MRIAVLELYEHWELIGYLREALAWADCDYYLSEVVAARPEAAGLRSVRVVGTRQRREAVAEAVSPSRGADIVLVCTRNVEQAPWYALAQVTAPVVLVLHDARFSFSRAPILAPGLLNRLRRVRWRLAGDWSARTLNPGHPFVAFVTSAPGGQAYLRSEGVTEDVLAVPFAYWPTPTTPAADHDLRSVVVPGSIDPEHRDYEAVATLCREYYGPALSLKLPGRPRSSSAVRTLEWLRRIAADNPHVDLRTAGDAPDAYAETLRRAWVLLIPAHTYAFYATQREEVGRTKGLGAFDDQVRYGKCAIVPAGIPTWRALAHATVTYSTHAGLLTALGQAIEAPTPRPPETLTLSAVRAKWRAFLTEVAARR